MNQNGTMRRMPGRREKLLEFAETEMTEGSDDIQLVQNMNWFRERLGKFPSGANLLMSGDPGVGKSTLALQIAAAAATAGVRVLYLATEQSGDQVRERLAQLCGATRAQRYLTIKDDLFDIRLLPQLLSHQILRVGTNLHGTRLIVIDSLQGASGVNAQNNRVWSGVLEFLRQASSAGISTLCLAHMTKNRAISGPRTLEHACDVVLLLRYGASCRGLIVQKNRFGPAQVEPLGLAIDRDTTRLEPSPLGAAATARVRTVGSEGTIDLEVAITPVRGERGFIKSPGLSIKEVETTIDLLERTFDEARFLWAMGVTVRAADGIRYSRDFNVSISAAVLAALCRLAPPPNYLFIGDLSLEGNVRPPGARALAAIADAQAAGVVDSTSIFVVSADCPPEVLQDLSNPIVRIHNVRDLPGMLEVHHD